MINILELTNAEELENIVKSHENVLLDFYTTTCNPCKMQSQIFDELYENQTCIDNLLIIKINAEDGRFSKRARDVGVSSVPHLIGFKHNEIFYNKSGLIMKQDIIEKFKKK